MGVVLALLAACANALSSVLQRRAARQIPGDAALSLQFLERLLRSRAWYPGILALIAGFLLQAAALSQTRLSVVEPLLIVELPLTLVLASLILGGRLRARDWSALTAVTVGLAGLLAAARPSGGNAAAVSAWHWILCAIAAAAAIGALLLAALRSGGALRGALLGAVAGIGFGLTAALIKVCAVELQSGPAKLLSSWAPYATVACGIGSVLIFNNAVHVGTLLAVQPAVTLGDPIASVLLGVALFGEHLRTGTLLAPEILAIAAIAAGTFALAHSLQPATDRGRAPRDV